MKEKRKIQDHTKICKIFLDSHPEFKKNYSYSPDDILRFHNKTIDLLVKKQAWIQIKQKKQTDKFGFDLVCVDKKTKRQILLVEAEHGNTVGGHLHIYGHIFRVYMLIQLNAPITKLIWVVNNTQEEKKLRKIISSVLSAVKLFDNNPRIFRIISDKWVYCNGK
jgi:hypothetical protein